MGPTKKLVILLAGLLLHVAPIGTLAAHAATSAVPNGTAYALTTTNQLITFKVTRPDVILNSAPVTGVQPGDQIRGIDVRPANGLLYGVGGNSRIYTINPTTGVASFVSVLSVPIVSTGFGIDFDPITDRLRIVGSNGQNLRINVDTGATVADPPVAANIVGAAYTNSFVGASSTQLLVFDPAGPWYLLDPSTGMLTPIGAGGTSTDDFASDISPDNLAFAAPHVAGQPNSILVAVDIRRVLTGSTTIFNSVMGIIGGPSAPPVRGLALAGPACTITGAGRITGTPGNDVICGSAGGEQILAGGGRDLVLGFEGDDVIGAGDGTGVANGDAVIFGGDGSDFIYAGGTGTIAVHGGFGTDRLMGGPGNDTLRGDQDDDDLNGGGGVNRLDGGPGTDRCASANGGLVTNCEA